MAESKEELIRLLEAELNFIEGGGYGQSAGKPNEEKPMFKGSLACINHWFVPGHESECHDDCVLLPWVPSGARNSDLPCHHIPLNPACDTVRSLEDRADREHLEEQVKKWLRKTIEELKKDAASPGPLEVKY